MRTSSAIGSGCASRPSARRAKSAHGSATSTAGWRKWKPTTCPTTRGCRPKSNACADRRLRGREYGHRIPRPDDPDPGDRARHIARLLRGLDAAQAEAVQARAGDRQGERPRSRRTRAGNPRAARTGASAGTDRHRWQLYGGKPDRGPAGRSKRVFLPPAGAGARGARLMEPQDLLPYLGWLIGGVTIVSVSGIAASVYSLKLKIKHGYP